MTKVDRALNFIFPLFSGLVLLFFIPTWSGLDVGKTYFFVIGTLLLSLFFIGSALYQKSLVLPNKKLLAAFGGLLLLVFLSACFARVPWMAFFGRVLEISTVIFMVTSVLFLMLGMYYFSNIKNTGRYLRFISIFFSVAVIFQIGLFLLPKVFSLSTFTQKAQSLVGTWHDLGALAVVFLFVALYNFFHRKMTQIQTIGFSAMGLASLCLIFLSNLRYLYVTALILATYILVVSIQTYRRNVIRYLIPLCVVIVLILGAFFQPKIATVLMKQGVTYSEVKPAIGSTLVVLKHSILSNPLLGSGANHFFVAWSQGKPAVVNNSALWSTQFNVGYSSFFTFAVNYGVVFALGILTLLALYIFFSGRTLIELSKKDKRNAFSKYLLSTRLFFIISLFYIYLFFTQNFGTMQWVMFISTISLVLGHLYHYGVLKFQTVEYHNNFSKQKKAIYGVVVLACVSIIGYLGVVSVTKVYAYSIAERATDALTAGENDTALLLFSRAYGIDRNDIYARLVAQSYFKKVNEVGAVEVTDENRETLQAYFKNTFTQAVQSGQVAYNRNTVDLDNVFNLIGIYRSVIPVVKDAYPQTINMIDAGLTLSPNNPTLHLLRARVEFDNGNTKEAQKFAELAVQAKGNYSEAYVFLSRLAALDQNKAKAKEYLEYAILADQQNLTALSEYATISLDEKDYELAVGVLSRMLTVDPMLHQARFYLALTLVELDQTQEAIAQLEILQTYFPDNTDLTNQIKNLKNPAIETVENTETNTETQ